VDAMAPAELVRLVGNDEKVAMLAELLEEEAKLYEGEVAEGKREKAAALRSYLPAHRK
jgi:hypothetical protein